MILTLLVIALYQPLRPRLQDVLDRCFYRSRYDAGWILDLVAQARAGPIDLDALSDELVVVLRQTLQPAHVSVWFRAVAR